MLRAGYSPVDSQVQGLDVDSLARQNRIWPCGSMGSLITRSYTQVRSATIAEKRSAPAVSDLVSQIGYSKKQGTLRATSMAWSQKHQGTKQQRHMTPKYAQQPYCQKASKAAKPR